MQSVKLKAMEGPLVVCALTNGDSDQVSQDGMHWKNINRLAEIGDHNNCYTVVLM